MLTISQGRYRISDFRLFSIPELCIEPRQSWAFVGSNGSGKSVLARVIAGAVSEQSGEHNNRFAKVARLSLEQLQKLVDEEWNRNNTDLLSADEDDIGRTTAQIIQAQVSDADRCEALAQQFGIAHLLERRFKYLSTGETRKTLLCQVLMSKPDLLVLDEPFDGLDVLSRQQLAKTLAALSAQGMTLVLVLNRFDDIPDFIDHVGVLVECELVKQGPKAAMLQDEMIKQFTNLEHLAHFTLPPSDDDLIVLDANVPRIKLNNGYVHYNDKAIINGLTWQVNAGEHWQIIGPNGAGKSTLLSLITGDHPQGYSNDLSLFGRQRGSGETIWDIKKHIGYVSSSLHLDYRVSSSVRNVLISGYFDSIGVYNAISDKQLKLANEWLILLNLLDKADQPFHSLSWGQQRLILIARALVKHPILLILDEPLQGLDQLNRELVKRWIDRLIEEGHSQLLFVSHHAEDAPNCISHCLTFVSQEERGYQYKMTESPKR
ncbi:molybdate ABC transporter ATP-binding protein ModF [Utexia brackfieldae]|uniref:molybdate ABC transporter ATP-binding protein ModF n=1 Tax=Utexia brackfieldae TaxID=3074108 RepID=UPI00370D66F6